MKHNLNTEVLSISLSKVWWPLKGPVGSVEVSRHSLLGAGVLGDGLGSLRDGVLGQLSGQEEPDSGLDLPGGDGGPLVVVGMLVFFWSIHHGSCCNILGITPQNYTVM